MPPQETTSTSNGRSSAFTSGLGTGIDVNEKQIVTDMAKATPGIVKDAAINEYKHATENPGNQVQRTGGHLFNVLSDTVGMVANAGSAAGNALMTEGQNRLSDVGAGLTNWASSMSAGMVGASGYSGAGAQGSSKYRDVNPIPEVTMPKVDTTPGNKVWQGGSVSYRPKVGTAATLGVHVPGDPFTTVDRGLNLLGTATLPVNGVGVAVKGAGTAVRAAGKTAAGQAVKTGAARGAQFAGEKVAPSAVAAGMLFSPILHEAPAAARTSMSAAIKADAADAASSARFGVPDGASSKINPVERPSEGTSSSTLTKADDLTKTDTIAPNTFDNVKEQSTIREAITKAASRSRVDDTNKPDDDSTKPKDLDTKKKPKPDGENDGSDYTQRGQNVNLRRIN